MGKKLDALLRRTFKTSKFVSLVHLAISRLAVLKNQRQIRSSQARSDTIQLLNLGHQDRALLRVEVVIKEQNMLDVLVMIEGYCHVLIERVALIEHNKECPDELKEAISSLIFAASRCGEFPELQELRTIFATRFGKDFVARAVELRNNSGVHPKMIQKLSTRQPSYESRKKILEEIASENGIILHLEEKASVTKEQENINLNQKMDQPKINVSDKLDDTKYEDHAGNFINQMDQIEPDEQTSGSLRTRKRYADVASAAQAAFESAAHAAAAARAAVELSRSDSNDNFPSGSNTPIRKQKNSFDNDGSTIPGFGNRVVNTASNKVEHPKVHHAENSSSDSEDEELQRTHNVLDPRDFKERTSREIMERSLSASSSDSAGDSIKIIQMPPNALSQTKSSDKMIFDKSDDEMGDEYGAVPRSNEHEFAVDGKSTMYNSEVPRVRKTETNTYSKNEVHSNPLNVERRPMSMRTRREHKW